MEILWGERGGIKRYIYLLLEKVRKYLISIFKILTLLGGGESLLEMISYLSLHSYK